MSANAPLWRVRRSPRVAGRAHAVNGASPHSRVRIRRWLVRPAAPASASPRRPRARAAGRTDEFNRARYPQPRTICRRAIVLWFRHPRYTDTGQVLTCLKSCPKTATYRSLRFLHLAALMPSAGTILIRSLACIACAESTRISTRMRPRLRAYLGALQTAERKTP
jgi:hypothetical protein